MSWQLDQVGNWKLGQEPSCSSANINCSYLRSAEVSINHYNLPILCRADGNSHNCHILLRCCWFYAYKSPLMHVGNRKTMTNIKKILKPHTHYNWPYNRLIIAPILVSIALLGDRCLVILINWRLNCGRSILNLFDYLKHGRGWEQRN